jgi:hypothetical protein
MFATDITLNPTTYGGTNANKVYSLIVGPTADGRALRRVASTATTTPDTLTVSHRESTQSGVLVDQHLVRIDEIQTDPVLGKVTLSAWMVIQVPRGTTIITTQLITDQIGRLIHFEQTSGNLAKILNSEP